MKQKVAGDIAQEVDHLPCKHKALRLSPRALKKKNRKEGRKVWIKVKGNAQGPGFYLQNQREERGRRETMAQIS
jgi:hypothetical protein